MAVRLAGDGPGDHDAGTSAPEPGSAPPDAPGPQEPVGPGPQHRAPVAAYGKARAAVHTIDLVHQGELVGTLEVGQRSDTEPLSVADLRLLDDIARQVAVAAHAARLAEDLQESRERLVLALHGAPLKQFIHRPAPGARGQGDAFRSAGAQAMVVA